MKQAQRQVVKVIVNNRRPVGRRRRTRRVLKEQAMPVNPYATVPQQFVPPIKKNLETGYNLYSKLAEQKGEEIKKKNQQLDERSTNLDQRAVQLNDRETSINDAMMVADKSLGIREKNLQTIAEDLDLRFRTPAQTVLTQPIYINAPTSETSSIRPSSPAKTSLSPPTFASPAQKPSFKDALTGGATPPPPPLVKSEPKTPQSATKQLKDELEGVKDTASIYINSITSREVIVGILQNLGERPGSLSLTQLKKLLRRIVQENGISSDELEAMIQTRQEVRKVGGAGGGSSKKKKG